MSRRAHFWLLPLVIVACGDVGETPRVQIETNLTFPHALLDKVTGLEITVWEGATCDETTGATTKDSAKSITKKTLGTTSCAPSAKFCGDIPVEKSDTPRVFEAIGTDGAGATLATGCTTATVNQDALPIAIKMFRFIAPAVCGDGAIQPTEQCERVAGNEATCDAQCQSVEVLLSSGATQNGTKTGTVGDKTDPFFLWPTGAGQAGWFYAFFTDHVNGATNLEVTMRVMNDDLSPSPAAPAPPAFGFGSLYLPYLPTFPSNPAVKSQSQPQAASLGGEIWVVFQDDNPVGVPSNGLDVHLRSMSPSAVADQDATPLGINGANGTGEAGIQQTPAIAASNGKLFVAWEDQGAGKITGRAVTPPGAPAQLGSQNDISTGNGNSHVSLAATPTGWVCVWQSGSGIKLRAISADGTPSGAEQSVNDGGASPVSPRVASLDGGRFAVTWVAGDDVFVQRYDQNGTKIAGDQLAAVNNVVVDGKQSNPAIGGSSGAGGSYVVAWADEASGHIRARMLGGSKGFLFNNVDGQSNEFKASGADGRTRNKPAVVSGGSTPFVAIGWEDSSVSGPGIVARRFPLASE